MDDAKLLLKNIEFKINKIVIDFYEEKERNKIILEEQQKLLDKIIEQESIIDDLREKNRLLKIKNTIDNSTDSKEVKMKINELVREIDRCIDLLQNNKVL